MAVGGQVFVRVGVLVAVVAVGDASRVDVRDAVDVFVGVGDGVLVSVAVAVSEGVAVSVAVGVLVGVSDGVRVELGVAV